MATISEGDPLKVKAYAGAGNTSTLRRGVQADAVATIVSTFRSKPLGHVLPHLIACFWVWLQKFQT